MIVSKKWRAVFLKQIYILLSRTGTVPSKMIYFFTRKHFTHASISLAPQTDCFYSYARRRLHNCLIAGLVRENVHTEVFKMFENGECALYSLEVSDESYDKIAELINHYWSEYDKCTYKFSAIIPMWLGIKQRLNYKMTCSQFVASLIQKSNAYELPKHPSLMHPTDFLQIKEMTLLYTGKIKDCHFPCATKDA